MPTDRSAAIGRARPDHPDGSRATAEDPASRRADSEAQQTTASQEQSTEEHHRTGDERQVTDQTPKGGSTATRTCELATTPEHRQPDTGQRDRQTDAEGGDEHDPVPGTTGRDRGCQHQERRGAR